MLSLKCLSQYLYLQSVWNLEEGNENMEPKVNNLVSILRERCQFIFKIVILSGELIVQKYEIRHHFSL